ncbi:unnamed protein product [Cyprideis torosa]|uniref:Uncharacterized protein n=1 Tax=Cyprideis torosa TaxID=163714 RepID=A0A7R8ZQ14_9CRUS|nr:unnamed protein product [Cyprideis torosa]CAG0889584.1 unnamed protein product [Cyprideis torosa]
MQTPSSCSPQRNFTHDSIFLRVNPGVFCGSTEDFRRSNCKLIQDPDSKTLTRVGNCAINFDIAFCQLERTSEANGGQEDSETHRPTSEASQYSFKR